MELLELMKAAVNHPVLRPFGDFERPGFIFVQCPEVVFFVEVSLTACRLVCLELCIAYGHGGCWPC